MKNAFDIVRDAAHEKAHQYGSGHIQCSSLYSKALLSVLAVVDVWGDAGPPDRSMTASFPPTFVYRIDGERASIFDVYPLLTGEEYPVMVSGYL